MNALHALLCCSLISLASAQSPGSPPSAPEPDPLLHFESMPGDGQAYIARGAGGRIIADGSGLQVELVGGRARMELVGGTQGSIHPESPTPAVSNYFIGRDQSQWRHGVKRYRRLRVEAALPGIDLVYYGARNRLEFDFILDPGVDVDQVRMRWSGVDRVWVDEAGRLHLELADSSAYLEAPRVYEEGKADITMPSRYRMLGDKEVGFVVEGRDENRRLVIDPILVFGTVLGGSGGETPEAVDVDSSGNMVVVGSTASADFPVLNPIQGPPDFGGSFVTKYDAAGNVVYSTYLLQSAARAVRFDSLGNAYVTGIATGNSFPTSAGAVQPVHQGGGDTFCTKINPAGGLLWSTFLGGPLRDYAVDVEVGISEKVYILLNSRFQFPVTPNGYNIKGDGWIVASFDSFGNLDNSTNLGFDAAASDMAIDEQGTVFVVGGAGDGVPTLPTAYIPSNAGGAQGFVMALQSSLEGLVLATYFDVTPSKITLHREVGLIGAIPTLSFLSNSANLPVTGSLVTAYPGQVAFGYVAQLNDNMTGLRFMVQLPWIDTFLGGLDQDAAGNLYLAGWVEQTLLPPLVNAYWGYRVSGAPGGFLMKLDPQATQILYSTAVGDRDSLAGSSFGGYPGGLAVTDAGEAIVVGNSIGYFETSAGAPQSSQTGNNGVAYLAKFSADSMQEYGMSSEILPPVLSGAGDLTLGGSLHLRVRDCEGMVPGVLFVGSSRTNLPASFLVGNPILLVNAPRSIPFVATQSGDNYGSWDFDRSLVGATALVGMQFNVQAVVLDSTFTEVRSSRALEFTIL